MRISSEQRKEIIILTAVDLIHENGIHNVSTKEIAKRLEISEGLLFKIFPRKNDLLSGVLDRFSIYDRDIFVSAVERNEDTLNAIRYFTNAFISYYENYPAITALFQAFDAFKGNAELENKYNRILIHRTLCMEQLVDQAKETGRIINSIDSEALADMLIFTIRGMCLKWRLFNFSFPLKEKTICRINLLLEAVSTKEGGSKCQN